MDTDTLTAKRDALEYLKSQLADLEVQQVRLRQSYQRRTRLSGLWVIITLATAALLIGGCGILMIAGAIGNEDLAGSFLCSLPVTFVGLGLAIAAIGALVARQRRAKAGDELWEQYEIEAAALERRAREVQTRIREVEHQIEDMIRHI